ncbi:hypothetical protein BCR34DRAFT_599614 [Clohesyomyces aquaticus]|uniref:Uncharacterized protein n=1 Tax=Clohesyomyces aquaticus TaxID=1231657 RepID=A0A1Y1ZUE3_9PLEO|nr:hypothetical protein BCR34DRAFT_599614 [Clohesyomyces aquaticus]
MPATKARKARRAAQQARIALADASNDQDYVDPRFLVPIAVLKAVRDNNTERGEAVEPTHVADVSPSEKDEHDSDVTMLGADEGLAIGGEVLTSSNDDDVPAHSSIDSGTSTSSVESVAEDVVEEHSKPSEVSALAPTTASTSPCQLSCLAWPNKAEFTSSLSRDQEDAFVHRHVKTFPVLALTKKESSKRPQQWPSKNSNETDNAVGNEEKPYPPSENLPAPIDKVSTTKLSKFPMATKLFNEPAGAWLSSQKSSFDNQMATCLDIVKKSAAEGSSTKVLNFTTTVQAFDEAVEAWLSAQKKCFDNQIAVCFESEEFSADVLVRTISTESVTAEPDAAEAIEEKSASETFAESNNDGSSPPLSLSSHAIVIETETILPDNFVAGVLSWPNGEEYPSPLSNEIEERIIAKWVKPLPEAPTQQNGRRKDKKAKNQNPALNANNMEMQHQPNPSGSAPEAKEDPKDDIEADGAQESQDSTTISLGKSTFQAPTTPAGILALPNEAEYPPMSPEVEHAIIEQWVRPLPGVQSSKRPEHPKPVETAKSNGDQIGDEVPGAQFDGLAGSGPDEPQADVQVNHDAQEARIDGQAKIKETGTQVDEQADPEIGHAHVDIQVDHTTEEAQVDELVQYGLNGTQVSDQVDGSNQVDGQAHENNVDEHDKHLTPTKAGKQPPVKLEGSPDPSSPRSRTSSTSSIAGVAGSFASQTSVNGEECPQDLNVQTYDDRRTFIGTISLEDFIDVLNCGDDGATNKMKVCEAFAALAAHEHKMMGSNSATVATYEPDTYFKSVVAQNRIKIGAISLYMFLKEVTLEPDGSTTDLAVDEAFQKCSRNENLGPSRKLERLQHHRAARLDT